MADQPRDSVDRCVEFVLSFLRTDMQQKHMTPQRRRAEHDKALAYLDRLPRQTLRAAMDRLFRLGEQAARGSATAAARADQLRRR